MSSTATVTAKTGPGVSVTSLVLTDVVEFGFNCDQNCCFVKLRNAQVKYFAGYSTITVTVSGGNYTLTLS